jgi:hypothetical protein
MILQYSRTLVMQILTDFYFPNLVTDHCGLDTTHKQTTI